MRSGGEEFVLLLHDCNAEDGLRRLEQLRQSVEAAGIQNPDAPDGLLTVSLGGALRNEAESLSDLMHRADRALYRAKHSGRNCALLDEGGNIYA